MKRTKAKTSEHENPPKTAMKAVEKVPEITL